MPGFRAYQDGDSARKDGGCNEELGAQERPDLGVRPGMMCRSQGCDFGRRELSQEESARATAGQWGGTG